MKKTNYIINNNKTSNIEEIYKSLENYEIRSKQGANLLGGSIDELENKKGEIERNLLEKGIYNIILNAILAQYRAFVLIGPPGIGKTYACLEFLKRHTLSIDQFNNLLKDANPSNYKTILTNFFNDERNKNYLGLGVSLTSVYLTKDDLILPAVDPQKKEMNYLLNQSIFGNSDSEALKALTDLGRKIYIHIDEFNIMTKQEQMQILSQIGEGILPDGKRIPPDSLVLLCTGNNSEDNIGININDLPEAVRSRFNAVFDFYSMKELDNKLVYYLYSLKLYSKVNNNAFKETDFYRNQYNSVFVDNVLKFILFSYDYIINNKDFKFKDFRAVDAFSSRAYELFLKNSKMLKDTYLPYTFMVPTFDDNQNRAMNALLNQMVSDFFNLSELNLYTVIKDLKNKEQQFYSRDISYVAGLLNGYANHLINNEKISPDKAHDDVYILFKELFGFNSGDYDENAVIRFINIAYNNYKDLFINLSLRMSNDNDKNLTKFIKILEDIKNSIK